jgi:hypothetical protein
MGLNLLANKAFSFVEKVASVGQAIDVTVGKAGQVAANTAVNRTGLGRLVDSTDRIKIDSDSLSEVVAGQAGAQTHKQVGGFLETAAAGLGKAYSGLRLGSAFVGNMSKGMKGREDEIAQEILNAQYLQLASTRAARKGRDVTDKDIETAKNYYEKKGRLERMQGDAQKKARELARTAPNLYQEFKTQMYMTASDPEQSKNFMKLIDPTGGFAFMGHI